MAMAALLSAARKLGGQRAATQQQALRVLSIRSGGSTMARPSVAGAGATAPNDMDSAEKIIEARHAEFHVKAEELYNLCAALNKYNIYKTERLADLCIQLAVQIKPRPSDPEWRLYRLADRLGLGMVFVTSSIGMYLTYNWLARACLD